uniref:KIAA1614 n=1 Tax=Pelusios castaneus TaxID=367368 RepID=A0A8C8VFF0_9SAUR
MEGSSPTEKGRATGSTKQCSSNAVRRNFPPGSAESSSNQLVRAAKEPAGLSRAAHSVLEAKVKALKEKRLATKPGGAVSQEGASLKKPKVRKGKHMPGLAVAERVSQDAVVEPQAQIRTYLTDVLLDSSDNVNLGLGARRAVVADLYADNAEALKAHQTRGVGSAWDCSSAEEVWRVQSPGRNVLEKPDCYLETRTQRGSPNGLWGTSSAKNPASSSQKSSLEENGKPTPFEEELPQARDLESIPLVPKDDLCGGLAPSEHLWGTESWGSVGSATSVLSLAERVERNRALLQEMLSLSRQNRSPLEPRKSRCHEREALRLTKDGTAQDQLANDLDWDSGVSLQDSEGYRPFVPAQELELSPRHEKAKQLLQRARMKARTSPLRASHDILPAVLQARREAGRSAALDLKKSFALKDGEAQASGNLSDSSSGESSCGQPRKRGPSPSRVRFEDESVRDAEVRYLERSQLRQKRVLDSVLLTLGQSPLVSKPDLSDYVNGDFYCPEHGVSKACKERQSHGQAAGASAHLGSRGSSEKAGPTVLSAEGKCKACGSYISGSAVNQYADDRAGQSINRLLEGRSIAQENKTVSITADSGEPGASQHETRGRTLGPRGSPLWILPSHQSIHTERIRETYIGEVTYIDDVDSALDSTDTSDSCRTDSEEAGPGTPYTVGSQDPGGCWPGGHQASRGTGALEKDPKGRKGGQEKCRVNGSGGDRVLDNASGTGRAAVGEERNSSLKEMEVLKEGQGTNPPAREVKALSKGDQPPAPPPLAGKDSSRGRAVLTPTQQRHIHPLPPHGPVPPPTGKALSPVPYTGGRDQTSDIATRPTSPPSKRSSGPEEQRSQCSPKVLSKDRLLALSTNNCNNTRARRQHDGPAPGMAPRQPEATGSDQKGKSNGLSSAAAPSAALRTISSAGITLSLASKEMGPTQAGRLPSGEAPASGSQQF